MFHKAQEFLQHRILNKMPPSFRRIIENVDVITRPKVSCFLLQVGQYSVRPAWLHLTVLCEESDIQGPRPVVVCVRDLEKCEHDFPCHRGGRSSGIRTRFFSVWCFV